MEENHSAAPESKETKDLGLDAEVLKESWEPSLEEYQALEQALSESKDRYLRLLAEVDNARKRNEKERLDWRKYGAEPLAKDLLSVLDGFDRVDFETKDPTEALGIIQGLALLKRSLGDILQKHGLAPIEAKGQVFDPNLHQAIQRIEAPGIEDEQVKDVFAKGYLFQDRLLRPAMVSVEVPQEPADNPG